MWPQWAVVGVDVDMIPNAASTPDTFPNWAADGFHTINSAIFEFDDGSTTSNFAAGIRVLLPGFYEVSQLTSLAHSGDHSASPVNIQPVYVDGGGTPEWMTGDFGAYDVGYYNGVSTVWQPLLHGFVNLVEADLPATITFQIFHSVGVDLTSYPRMVVIGKGLALDEAITFPLAS